MKEKIHANQINSTDDDYRNNHSKDHFYNDHVLDSQESLNII